MQDPSTNDDNAYYTYEKPSNPEDYREIKFKDSDHKVYISHEKQAELDRRRHSTTDKVCFMCGHSLKGVGNYKTVMMKDKDGNPTIPAFFHSECHRIYDMLETKPQSYITHPRKEGVEECAICRQELELDLYFSTKLCKKRPAHRMKVCMDCCSGDNVREGIDPNINLMEEVQNTMYCKHCAGKEYEACAINFPQVNFLGRYSIPVLIIGENSLGKDVLEVDPETCPITNPVSIGSTLLVDLIDESIEPRQFYMGSSTARVGDFFINSGGFQTQTDGSIHAIALTHMVRFLKEVNIKHYNFPRSVPVAKLNRKRYFHKMVYSDKHKVLVCLGGMDIRVSGVLSWLDSIEISKIEYDKAGDFINSGDVLNWEILTTKLARKRAYFEAFAKGDFVYSFGGFNGFDSHENSIERFSIPDKKSEVVEFKTPPAFAFPASTLILPTSDGRYMLLGGQVAPNMRTKKSYFIDADRKEIVDTGSSLKYKRAGHKGTFITRKNGKRAFIVFGGCWKEKTPHEMSFELLIEGEEGEKWKEFTLNKILDLQILKDRNSNPVTAMSIPYTDCYGFKFHDVNFDLLEG